MVQWWQDYGSVLAIFAGLELAIGLVITLCMVANRAEAGRLWWLLLVATCSLPVAVCTVGSLLPNRPHHPGVVASMLEAMVLWALPLLSVALLAHTHSKLGDANWVWRGAVYLLCSLQFFIDALTVLAAGQLFSGVSL